MSVYSTDFSPSHPHSLRGCHQSAASIFLWCHVEETDSGNYKRSLETHPDRWQCNENSQGIHSLSVEVSIRAYFGLLIIFNLVYSAVDSFYHSVIFEQNLNGTLCVIQ